MKKARKFRSLTVTLAIAFLALSVVVLLIASSLSMYFSFQNQQKLIINEQQLIAQNAANTVKSFVQEKLGILERSAVVGSLSADSHEEQKTILERLLGKVPSFRQLVLLDAQKQELAKVSRLSNLVSYGFIKQIGSDTFSQVSQGKMHISSVYIDEVTSEPMVIMAVPVKDTFGDIKGTLLAEVNLKFMWDLVGGIKVGNKGLAYVVDRQGNLIASGDISCVLRGENLIHLNEVNKFVKGDELTHKDSAEVVKGIQGNLVVANHAHLGTPDWAVVVELPALEAYETVITTLVISGLIMLLSFALAIIFGVFLSKRIAKPIISLRDAAVRIGEGRLDTQIEIKKNDEIGDLAAAFNQMTENLRKTTTSIDNLNREITVRKKAEQRQAELLNQLTNVNGELKSFAYVVSHDLKVPLRGIRNLADWLSTDYKDKLDDKGKEQLSLLMNRVDRMQSLIDGILQYSRVGRVEEEKTVVNLNELAPEIIDTIAPPDNITITVESQLPEIECSRTRITQVFQNLLSNAVKYMDKPQGQIKIGCVEENGFWKFSVADNGPGIEEQYFEKIFQLFQTLASNDESESTGVGLTVTKKIVELYDGKIWVESKVGQGSTFFFTLPKQEIAVKEQELQISTV